jgi:hypothetical protein
MYQRAEKLPAAQFRISDHIEQRLSAAAAGLIPATSTILALPSLPSPSSAGELLLGRRRSLKMIYLARQRRRKSRRQNH